MNWAWPNWPGPIRFFLLSIQTQVLALLNIFSETGLRKWAKTKFGNPDIKSNS